MPREKRLVAALVELVGTLADDFDTVDVLRVLAHRCVDLLDVDAAGLMLVDQDGQFSVLAASSDPAHTLQLEELRSNAGPAMECFRTSTVVVLGDIGRVEGRWPAIEARAVEAGFRSVYALPMRRRDEAIGVLTLLRSGSSPPSQSDVEDACALVDVVTICLIQQRIIRERTILTEQLQTALNSRIVIEQAKGILAERLKLDMDRSFALLRSHARNTNTKLSDVARAVIAGTLELAGP